MEVKFKELNKILEATDALYHEAAKKMGVSDIELFILYELVEAGEAVPQRKFYNEIGVSKSTINSAIKKMERSGFIVLKAIDGRSTEVELTKEGQVLSKNTAERLIEIENRIYDSWSEKEREAIINLNRDYMDKFAVEVEKL